MDESYSKAQAAAIQDGKIIEVGTNKDIGKYEHEAKKILDSNGKLVLPGFNDSHMHLLSYGIGLSCIDLLPARNIKNDAKLSSSK